MNKIQEVIDKMSLEERTKLPFERFKAWSALNPQRFIKLQDGELVEAESPEILEVE